MNVAENVRRAQQHATDMLECSYDDERHIPVTAGSHGDLWPGDRWEEAYLAIDRPDIAAEVFDKKLASIRPDGSMPHLVSGSHKRAGLELKFIDRAVYVAQHNGIMHLESGEWVTRHSFAPPTLALSALALRNAGVQVPTNLATLIRAQSVLESKRDGLEGIIEARLRDELTNRDGELYEDEFKPNGRAVDLAINALSVLNRQALAELARGRASAWEFSNTAHNTKRLLRNMLENATVKVAEDVLAAARLGFDDLLTRSDLATTFEPGRDTQNFKKIHLTQAQCIEVARLTPQRQESLQYLARISAQVAEFGPAAMTRYEAASPSKNALSNRINLKQVALPVAAEIVQINPDVLA